MAKPARENVLVIDFGSQFSQLIARRLREERVYCEILPPSIAPEEVRRRSPRGIILSGGPASVYRKNAPTCDPEIFRMGIPILGICYGMQVGCNALGAGVVPAHEREYGRTEIEIRRPAHPLFAGVSPRTIVWMSHGDRVDDTDRHFRSLAGSRNCPSVAVAHRTIPFFGVQFHPEVVHTREGKTILRNFLLRICGCRGTWKIASYIDEAIASIRETVGNRKVLCALSGGVDSSVVAALLNRAVGKNLLCVFVDNGLVRENETTLVRQVFERRFNMRLTCVDAERRFLRRLRGVADPERKRKIIGAEFISVFQDAVRRLKGFDFLAQGTLYPDVIESRSVFGGPSAVIKSHHNVGGLPEKLGFKLIEPLRFLFKDEVRHMGRSLGLPSEIIERQPFPGPGLAVRVIGAVTKKRLDILRKVDTIVTREVEKADAHRKLWQYFAVLLPVSSVGVMGDGRTYENVVAVRAVESTDGMTADWARLSHDLLATISSRIINEVRGVNRVVYDISSKPPSTIEWE
ncbi:MAG: glutamine-hydrolyzing GMP synthase [Planctomycetes bacterium RBG_16_59_8]|nr:MAG: glutamine-hydrolyzing GMP synthase [Planctomycetes bacterium RBG_16_59_8]